MAYLSLRFLALTAAAVAVYYLLPLRFRWLALLAASVGFYYWMSPSGFWVFLAGIVISYAAGVRLGELQPRQDPHHRAKPSKKKRPAPDRALRRRQIVLILAVALTVIPLFLVKNGNYILTAWLHRPTVAWIVPLGISFYSLQMISYLVDVARGEIAPQRNLLKYALYLSFFPHIVQGPIPRYRQLGHQLYEGHSFDQRGFTKGLHLILWGLFLKLMIADKAAVFVDAVFDKFPLYRGGYVILAAILYSFQLYADFLACVSISRGVAGLFGIDLAGNFLQPYAARSIKDFWRRWHISLSTWLRDYIYIPLGGNRKGKVRKWLNLAVTFAISGIWHGAGLQFLVWGLLHAAYQIIGEVLRPAKDRLYALARLPEDAPLRRLLQTVVTFLLVTVAWVIFRAESLEVGLAMLRSAVTVWTPWILFDDSLFSLGLVWKEFLVLLLSIATLLGVEAVQRRVSIREWILDRHLVLRWGIYLLAVCVIWVCGTYGFGFEAKDFIYGGF